MPNLRLIGLAGLLCVCAATAHGEDAIPNFSSINSPWAPMGAGFQSPPSGRGPVTYDKAHPVLRISPNNRGEAVQAPLRLADLSDPNLKPWVVDYLRKANEELLTKGVRYASRASCRPGGVPQFLVYAGGFEHMYFIQTPTQVMLIHQANTEVRHIYLNVRHSEHPVPSWYGESIGRYEGDELVVDTIGFNDKTMVDDNYNVPHTTQLHVVERFKLIDEGKTLQVNVTVEDPGAFNAPWSAIVRYRHLAPPVLLTEEPCADQNVGGLSFHDKFFDVPTAANPDF
jgi:hypothetical protein